MHVSKIPMSTDSPIPYIVLIMWMHYDQNKQLRN